MIEKIEVFLKSKYYLVSIAALTFLLWFFNTNSIGPTPSFDFLELVGICLYVLAIAFILVFYKQTIYVFPLILFSIFMLSNQNLINMDNLNHMWILYIVIGIVIFSFIYHFFKYQVKLSKGSLTLGLLLLSAAFLFSIINYFVDGKSFEISIIVISAMGLLYLFIYTLFLSTNKGNYLPYLLRTLYYLSFLVMLQTIVMLIFYFVDNTQYGSFIDIFKQGFEDRWGYTKNGFFTRLHVGWGMQNNIGGILALILPIHMYYTFINKSVKDKVLAGLGLLFTLVIIFLTTSRGAYLGVAAFGVLFIIAVIKYVKFDYKKYWKQLTVIGIVLLILAVPIFIFMFDYLVSFIQNGSILNGREADWPDAITFFLNHPILGSSWYSDYWYGGFRSYHNTFLHTIATMGLFGLGALLFHHYQIIRLFKKTWSFEVFIVTGMLIITHVHGLVDNTYYALSYMLIFMTLYGAIENKPLSEISLS